MKKLHIRAIGKLPEPWQNEAIHTYETRLRAFGGIEIVEMPEGHKGSTKPNAEKTKEIEGISLLKGIPADAQIIALDQKGTALTSEEFSSRLAAWTEASRTAVFLIGGSWGLSPNVLARADAVLSFGRMTFPHGLARVILLEQIYRGKMIAAGREYHK